MIFQPPASSRTGALCLALTLLALTVAPACNKVNLPGGGGVPGRPGGGAQCGDFGTTDGIARIDFQGKYKLAADAALRLQASLKAAAALENISSDLEADLMGVCAGLAADLGASGSYGSVKEACDAASAALTDVRGKLGARVAIHVAYTPPVCRASMSAMAECTASCTASVDPGEVKVECEGGKLSGQCSGRCEGRCDVEAGARCSGVCKGECTADFSGRCDGTCNGKCDGKNSTGHCAGKCTGSCDLVADGQCKGTCKGACEIKGKAECSGTCTGSCSVEMQAPQCTGTARPPQASAECQGSCQAQVEAKAECIEPQVSVNVSAAAEADLATRYQAALDKHLPRLLRISIGMKDRLLRVADSAQAAAKAGAEVVKAGASVGVESANLASCVAARVEAAARAAVRVQASVQVSVSVSASATASAGAG